MKVLDLNTLKSGDRVINERGIAATIRYFKDNPDNELCLQADGVLPMFNDLPLERVKVPVYKLLDGDIIEAEDWDEIFKPIDNHFNDNQNIVFETYGKELDFVMRQDKNHIWTLVDGDDGKLYVSPGYHLCNRVHYLITEVPWVSKDIEALYV